MEKLTKNKIKRKLVTSYFFDCGIAESTLSMPSVNVYYDFKDKIKPFLFEIRYGFDRQEFKFSYDEIMKQVWGKTLVEIGIEIIKQNIPNYKGNFAIDDNERYLSEFGKLILCASSQKQVDEWIKKGQL